MEKFVIKYIFIYPIRFYQFFLSPFLPRSCRFFPSCSSFTIMSLARHGILRGGWLSINRLLSCHSFSRRSSYDPAP